MIRSISFVAACAVCFASTNLSAQVTLKPKIQPNKTWHLETEINSKQTLTLAGMDLDTQSTQSMRIKKSSGPQADDGSIAVKQETELLKSELSLPGGIEMEFDSSKPAPEPQGTQFDMLIDLFKVMSKANWTIVYGKDLQVVNIEGQDAILAGLDDNLKALMEKQLDKEYLKSKANDEFKPLPDGPVAQGDTWKRSFNMRLEGGQQLIFETEYEYQGTSDVDGRTLDKVTTKDVGVSYEIDEDAPTPLRVSDSELKIAESAGHYYFDREAGAIVQAAGKSQITGTITFSVNGMELPGKLDLTIQNKTARK